MSVRVMSKPHAMMSFAFSKPRRWHSSSCRSFHRNFSSSVICTTSGQRNTSCRYLVNMNGIRWPRCSASEDGPRPVYRYIGLPFS